MKGKAGLLACTLWALAGAVLLNDKPIPTSLAELLLHAANTDETIRVLDEGFHAALLPSSASLTSKGPSALRLPERHTVQDILRRLGGRPPETPRRKFLHFWK